MTITKEQFINNLNNYYKSTDIPSTIEYVAELYYNLQDEFSHYKEGNELIIKQLFEKIENVQKGRTIKKTSEKVSNVCEWR